jgi:hypothetical protein
MRSGSPSRSGKGGSSYHAQALRTQRSKPNAFAFLRSLARCVRLHSHSPTLPRLRINPHSHFSVPSASLREAAFAFPHALAPSHQPAFAFLCALCISACGCIRIPPRSRAFVSTRIRISLRPLRLRVRLHSHSPTLPRLRINPHSHFSAPSASLREAAFEFPHAPASSNQPALAFLCVLCASA